MEPSHLSFVLEPPMRVTVKGWFCHRDLSYAEAEAWHLTEAAKLAGAPLGMQRQKDHLQQAELNREWRLREWRALCPMPMVRPPLETMPCP